MDQIQFHNVARETVALLDRIHDRLDVMTQDAEILIQHAKSSDFNAASCGALVRSTEQLLAETLITLNRAVGALTPLAVAGLQLQMVRYMPESGGR